MMTITDIQNDDRLVHATTPVTDDVQAWLERAFPEGDAYIEHDNNTCDMSSAGDECEGGCPVYTD